MSDSSGLADRLRRIQGAVRPEQPPAAKRREVPLPGWQRRGRHLWTRSTAFPNPLGRDRPLRLLTAGVDDEALCFVDTETTGLSGGAGTIAFLVGIGTPRGGTFSVTQYFVADYPGEPDLIDALAAELGEDRVIVSYNGKSFDVPILRSRFALHGRQLRIGRQIDLLHISRRLWRSKIGACTLHAIEESVLGVERDDDVDGFLVPDLYFDYLKTGDPSVLGSVFSHHLYDVVSLATLLEHIETLSVESPSSGVDAVELGRLMIERNLGAGVELLRERALSGSLPAARILSLHLKRWGRWDTATEMWLAMWQRTTSYFAGVELAKYYEHRRRDYRRALELVERLAALPLRGTPWAAAARADTARRRQRLLRKLAKGSGGRAPAHPDG